MSLFVNTNDAEARVLLGTRLDKYIEENGDYDRDDGLFMSSAKKFNDDQVITQLMIDVGHAVWSAYTPNLACIHLFLKDNVDRCHNNWHKPETMSANLGSEYLDVIGYYGLTTFNPSLTLGAENIRKALAHVVAYPLSKIRAFEIDLMIGPSVSDRLSPDHNSLSRVATHLYLLAFAGSAEPLMNRGIFHDHAQSGLMQVLGITGGSLTLDSLRASSLVLQTVMTEVDRKGNYGEMSTEEFAEFDGKARLQMALAFCLFPGQALVVDGYDPIEIHEAIEFRATLILQSENVQPDITRAEARSLANLVFAPFPELWALLKINPSDFLGKEISDLSVEDGSGSLLQTLGLFHHKHTKMECSKVQKVLAYNLSCYGYALGDDIWKRASTVPEIVHQSELSAGQVADLLDQLRHSKRFDSSAVLLQKPGLCHADHELLAKVLLKAMGSAKEHVIAERTAGGEQSLSDLLLCTKEASPQSIGVALELALEANDLDSVCDLMRYGRVPKHLIGKLPRHLRGDSLVNDMGL